MKRPDPFPFGAIAETDEEIAPPQDTQDRIMGSHRIHGTRYSPVPPVIVE
jgi:hypothetical protein